MKMNKKILSIAIGTTLVAASQTASADLSSTALLSFDDGVETCLAGGTYPDACTYGLKGITSGSYFAMDDGDSTINPGEKVALSELNGLAIGATQSAFGSHSGAPDASETANIDDPWSYFGNTGLHYTSSPVTLLSASGTAATVDMSGWTVNWNGIDVIPMGSGAFTGTASPGGTGVFDVGSEGVANITCAVDCTAGDTFILDYSATVPLGDPSGFGGVQYAFHLVGTIGAQTTTPDAFTFTDVTNLALSDTPVSNEITVSGIQFDGTTVGISVTGDGSYSVSTLNSAIATGVSATTAVSAIGDGATTTATVTHTAHGLVTGDMVTIAGAGDANLNGKFAVTVTGVDSYTYTAGGVIAAVADPCDATVPTDAVSVSHTAHGLASTDIVTISGATNDTDMNGTFAITVSDADTYTYTALSNVDFTPVLVSAVYPFTTFSTSVPSTVKNGDKIVIQHSHTAAFSETLATVLTLTGGAAEAVVGDHTFSSTTIPADTVPDAFTIPATTGATASTVTTSSASSAIAGINTDATISITAGTGTFSVNGGAFIAGPSTIALGETFAVRQTSSASLSTTSTVTIDIGGVTADFDVTTEASDAVPDAFTIPATTGATVSTAITSSASSAIAGINDLATISITAGTGTFSVDGGGFTPGPSTIALGQTFVVRQNSSASFSTASTVTIDIGGVTADFVVTTEASDAVPNAFTIPATTGATVSTVTTSSASSAIAGINTDATISITAGTGTFSVAGGAFTAGPGTIALGETFVVRQTSSASLSTTSTVTIDIGGVTADFDVTTEASDVVPDAFTIPATNDALVSTAITSSASSAVAGINDAATISITAGTGTFSVNGGAFIAGPSTIALGQTFAVRQTSSASFSTASTVTIDIGGVTADFVVTTEASDTAAQLTFTSQTGFNFAAPVTVTSETKTVTSGSTLLSGLASGINAQAAISVANGSYSIGGGAYTTAAGTINPGQTVTIQHTSSSVADTDVVTTLTIGGLDSTFTSSTSVSDPVPDAFTIPATTGATVSTVTTSSASSAIAAINTDAIISITAGTGTFSVNGGAFTAGPGVIALGQTFVVRQTSSASFSTASTVTIDIGGVTADFVVTTEASDTVPTAFTIPATTGATVSTVTTSSASSAIAGINDAATISITAGTGTFSVAGGVNDANPKTISLGQTFTVTQTSSASLATASTVTIDIGGVTADFVVTTEASDTVPTAFTIPATTGATVSTVTTSSASSAIAGINDAAAISITAGTGTFSVNGGAFTAGPGTIALGQTFVVRQTSSASFSTPSTVTIDIGGVTADYVVTTEASDVVPTAFTIPATTGAAVSTVTTSSASSAIAGINDAAAISILSGTGTFSVAGGVNDANPKTISLGQTFTVTQTSSALIATPSTVIISIGGVTANFVVTTVGADSVPDAFTVPATTAALVSTDITSSASSAIAGINTDATISITVGTGTFSVAGGVNDANPKTISLGQTFTVTQTSSASFATPSTVTIDIGGVTADFVVTTEDSDSVPDAFTFVSQTDVTRGAVATSATTIVAGINTGADISVANGEYSINGAAFTATPGVAAVFLDDTVAVRHTATTAALSDTVTTLTIGGVDGTFTSTTLANVVPEAVNDTGTEIDIAFDTSVVINVLSNDTDTDGGIDMTTVTIVTNGTKGTAVANIDGTVTYTPTPGLLLGDSFTYTVNDGDAGTSNVATVSVTILDSVATQIIPDNAVLSINAGILTSAAVTPADGNGSYFHMEVNPGSLTHTALTGLNHLQLGASQPATDATPDIDNVWTFFGNAGVHQTTSLVTVIADDTNGNVILDLSGWDVSWNAIPSIPMNANAQAPGFTDGQAQVTCQAGVDGVADCSEGDSYILEYSATVPLGDASGFGGVKYFLHLEGEIYPVGTQFNLGGGCDLATCPGDIADAVATTGVLSPVRGPVAPIAQGSTASSVGAAGIFVTAGDIGLKDPKLNDADGTQCIGGCIDFEVTGLTFGESIDVVVRLNTTIPAGTVFRKLMNGVWQDFDTTTGDAIGSAIEDPATNLCQGPNGTFDVGLREGNQCLYIKITDGGPNDADGVANGTIVDPSGVLLKGSPNVPAASSDGCSMSATPVALRDRADWLVVAGFIGFIALFRLRRKKV